ncbi:alpha/beta hydrolase [Silicimonas algicola]|uniref:Pimeloyl-ACP methyl ester carboxylesterase n=1 Tax=Silicimonas algicola TaxID=1826607 RepID=A0A316GCB2_9RHOB|nr:alpha/beta hydrolase [Silicimonas algicola]AZQ66245.1 alpha/beta hydrolase [Silicimonas algicola]PWK58558.1 pimeloyl-ACP methyl ester carboxylesterase [Silicimonas algicola]
MPKTFDHNVRRIAYDQTPGEGPGVVFLGGFKSDKEGTKALDLEAWARQQGRAYLRFDYSGHGMSSGDFLDGSIGDWTEDAHAILEAMTQGPQVLVGSSMGGWIALLLARTIPARVAGLVTIAAAPDFTEDGYWATFDESEKAMLLTEGRVERPSEYDDSPYIITRKLIEDGRKRLVLRDPLPLPFPVRFLQGTADTAVSTETAVRLLDHATGPDMRLTLVKDADHRFSTPECLLMIRRAVEEVIQRSNR